jgi:hypothetical protein
MITTSPRATCPNACPFKKDGDGPEAGLCYAEHGHLGHYIWNGLDKTKAGKKISGRIPVFSFDDLLFTVRSLPEGTLWRHNQAGDLPTDDQKTIARSRLRKLVSANRGRRGFTYTHYDVVKNLANRSAVKEANDLGFTVNLSADNLDEADELAKTECGPVTVVVRSSQMTNTVTPEGRKVIICPARTNEGMTCATCGICAVATRKAIIAFPALGPSAAKKA